jgi:hypothetical protein
VNVEAPGIRETTPPTRGPWATGVAIAFALVPLAVGIGIGIAMDRKSQLGPLTATQVLWWVLIPLGAIYPTLAAYAKNHAYAGTTVLVVAAIAPALALAIRVLLDPLPTDRLGHTSVSMATVAQRALPPAILAAGTFIAIEVASAGMRRGPVLGIIGSIAAAIVLGGFLLLMVVWVSLQATT